MAVSRTLSHGSKLLGIKQRWSQVVEAIGGVDATACFTRPGKTQISNYGVPNTDAFPPADAIVDAEAVCPLGPVLTKFLCEIAGGVFVPLPKPATMTDHLQQLGLILKGTGGLSVAITTALADREISATERAQILGELRTVIENAVGMMTLLESEGEG